MVDYPKNNILADKRLLAGRDVALPLPGIVIETRSSTLPIKPHQKEFVSAYDPRWPPGIECSNKNIFHPAEHAGLSCSWLS